MVRRVQVVLEDDLDGSTADETVTFSLDSIAYEIDLSTENAQSLRKLLQPYIDVSRSPGGGSEAVPTAVAGKPRRPRGRAAGAAKGRIDNRAVRAWARENGIEVSERGRLSTTIIAQYEAAHGG